MGLVLPGCRLTLFSIALILSFGVFASSPDVRLIIDVSGSMKKNDPSNLRRPAVELLVKLLPEGSQAGIWTFGSQVAPLVAHGRVNEGWREKALLAAGKINSIQQFTHIGQALEKVKPLADGEHVSHVILLTDGMVDIDKNNEINKQEWQRILQSVVPDYKARNIKIHTIALSPNADKVLMDRLALETGGSMKIAETSEALMPVFLSLFDQAVPIEQLPLKDNAFLTDSSIEEFTALIFKDADAEQTQLIGPAGTVYDKTTNDPDFSIYSTQEYDLITVRRPVEGEWKIKAKLKPLSRVTVVSDLSLVVDPIATRLTLGAPLTLRLKLTEEGKTIQRSEFLELLDITYNLNNTSDDELPWDGSLSDAGTPSDGIYSSRFGNIDQPGDYELAVKVDGKTFKRQSIHRFTIQQAFDISITPYQSEEGLYYKAVLNSNLAGLDRRDTQVVASLKDPGGASQIMPFSLNDKDQWVLNIRPDKKGEYELGAKVSKADNNDQLLASQTFHYPPKSEALAAEDNASLSIEKSAQVETSFLSKSEGDLTEEEPLVEEEPPADYRWILYVVLGIANLLIVAVAFFFYRMFSKNRGEDVDDIDDSEASDDQPEEDVGGLPAMDSMEDDLDEPSFDEPVDSIDDEELASIDLAEETTMDDIVDTSSDDSAAGSDDDEPEFSLDDFAPDIIEEEGSNDAESDKKQ